MVERQLNSWPRRRLPLVAGLGAFAALVLPAAAQAPPLEEVLRRTGEYLIGYETRLSTIVAEERYEQWILSSAGVAIVRRSLVSDFLLVRVADPSGGGWLGFRDVVRVDGKPVRSGENRFVAALSGKDADARGALERIGDENARHNLGDVYRTLNVPMLALDFLHPSYRARSTFQKSGEAEIDGTRTWKIDFTERIRPSLIRGARGRDRLARGTVWIEPELGGVLRTQLDVGGDDPIELLRSRVTVDFRYDVTLGMRVPNEMREVYEQRTRHTGGLARYRNFRRFETSARILPPQ